MALAVSKRIVVTGANKGIGKAIVQRILETDEEAFVYLGSRNAQRGQAAVDDLVKDNASWTNRLQMLEIDVTNTESVANAVETVRPGGSLYGVVHNAGVAHGGWEACVNVNAIGTNHTAVSFLPLMDRENGRVVFISSAAGPYYVVKLPEDQQPKWCNPAQLNQEVILAECEKAIQAGGPSPYGFSKTMTNAIMLYLAKTNPTLKINSCTPGWVQTDMSMSMTKGSGKTPKEMGMITPYEGAKSAIHLLFEDLGEISRGLYYGSDAVRSPLHKYRGPGADPYDGSFESENGIDLSIFERSNN